MGRDIERKIIENGISHYTYKAENQCPLVCENLLSGEENKRLGKVFAIQDY
jgi:hypothetical protein